MVVVRRSELDAELRRRCAGVAMDTLQRRVTVLQDARVFQAITNVRVLRDPSCPPAADVGTAGDADISFSGAATATGDIGSSVLATRELAAANAADLRRRILDALAAYTLEATGVRFAASDATSAAIDDAIRRRAADVVVQRTVLSQEIVDITATCVGLSLTNEGVVNLSSNSVGAAVADVILRSPEWAALPALPDAAPKPRTPAAATPPAPGAPATATNADLIILYAAAGGGLALLVWAVLFLFVARRDRGRRRR